MKDLKKLFSYKKEENRIFIIFFGIKIKFKRKQKLTISDIVNREIDEISSHWSSFGTTDSLLQILELKYSKNLSPTLFLIYICALLERGNNNKALKILNTYIGIYGLDLIAHNLPVANFAYENGYKNEDIEKSAMLFKTFEDNKHLFSEMIRGKTIAIVGNGSCEVGKNKGCEIDAHDVVIRFNELNKIIGYENDYGTKTSIWVRNLETQINIYNNVDANNMNISALKLLCLKLDYWHSFVDFNMIRKNIEGYKNFCACFTLEERKIISEMIQRDFHHSTVGFHIALLLSHYIKNHELIDFYGFSFLEGDSYNDHLYNKFYPKVKIALQKEHNIDFEAQFLKKNFSMKVKKYL